jgi:hypothetical protein
VRSPFHKKQTRLLIFLKARLGFGEFIAITRKPHVQRRQKKDTQKQRPNKASHNDDGEGPL